MIKSLKFFYLTIAILLIHTAEAQLKAIVKNSITGKSIPYVNIQVIGKDIGATADENGVFYLNNVDARALVFSAVGYETKIIDAGVINNVVYLSPAFKQLREVVVQNSLGTKKLTIERFKKMDIGIYFGSGAVSTAGIIAKPFVFKDSYRQTPFIRSLKIHTSVKKDKAKFNIRLYTIGKDGEPGEYLNDENIIAVATKGKKFTEVDLAHLKLQFPADGLFVAVEWLIIEDNKYHYEYIVHGTTEKKQSFNYDPMFGSTPSYTDSSTMQFKKGNWYNTPVRNFSFTDKYNGTYMVLACELTLTN